MVREGRAIRSGRCEPRCSEKNNNYYNNNNNDNSNNERRRNDDNEREIISVLTCVYNANSYIWPALAAPSLMSRRIFPAALGVAVGGSPFPFSGARSPCPVYNFTSRLALSPSCARASERCARPGRVQISWGGFSP